MGSTATPEDFILSPCTVDDIPSMIRIYEAAFATDYFGSFIFPRTIPTAKKHAWLRTRFLKQFAKPEIRCFKITEARTGIMAAWIRWGYPHVLTPEQEMERQNDKDRMAREGGSEWPEGANLELVELKFGSLDRFREKFVKWDDTYVVHLLVTDPAYQRKGLASKLLKHGLDLADAEDRQAYIEATRMGHPVYLKLGFRDVDSIEVDLRKWGGEGTGRNTIMLREPQPKV